MGRTGNPVALGLSRKERCRGGTAAQHCGPQGGDVVALGGHRVAVVGYGNLGRSTALNLRDSGVDVLVGSCPEPDADRARQEGFRVLPLDEAITGADVVWLALPDEVVPEVLDPSSGVQPRPASALVLSSGYTLAYDLAKVPDDVDVLLLAPPDDRAPHPHALRRRRRLLQLRVGGPGRDRHGPGPPPRAGRGLRHPASRRLRGRAGGRSGARSLRRALALELYLSGEMGATWDAFAEHGFFPGVRLHGHAAAFGGFVRLTGVDQAAMRRQFAEILDDIVSGGFARHLQEELAAGSPTRDLIDEMIGGGDPLSRAEQVVRGTEQA